MQGVFGGVQRVPGELDKEGLSRPGAFLHEGLGTSGHAENINRIWIGELKRLFVAGVAIVLVVAVLSRPAASDVPLAIVSRCITGLPEEFADGRLILSNVLDQPWLQQLMAPLGRRGLGPMKLGGAFSRLDTDAGGRADRRWGVGV